MQCMVWQPRIEAGPELSAVWTAQLFSQLWFLQQGERHSTSRSNGKAPAISFLWACSVSTTGWFQGSTWIWFIHFFQMCIEHCQLEFLPWTTTFPQYSHYHLPGISGTRELLMSLHMLFPYVWLFRLFFFAFFFLMLGKNNQIIINFGVNYNHLSVSYMM